MDDVELVWAQEGNGKISDDLAAILTTDTEERRIAAKTPDTQPQLSYQIP